MRIGLIADIHEAVELLDLAIARLQVMGIERFVILGDLVETGDRIEDVVLRLKDLDAVSVWGNHDYGLCANPAPDLRRRFSSMVIDYMATLRPWVTLEGCYFAHIEPWLDPHDLMSLWSIDFDRTFEQALAEDFHAPPERLCFMGHRHWWHAGNAHRVLPWRGEKPLSLPTDEPWLVVIHALVEGWCAILDTESAVIEPIELLGATPDFPWRVPLSS